LIDVEKGITDLEEASKTIPNNTEILLKLAGAIFQQLADTQQNN
jgi:hypothetical protein